MSELLPPTEENLFSSTLAKGERFLKEMWPMILFGILAGGAIWGEVEHPTDIDRWLARHNLPTLHGYGDNFTGSGWCDGSVLDLLSNQACWNTRVNTIRMTGDATPPIMKPER